jgi:hypothetical protein
MVRTVERDEGLAAEPGASMGDEAVGKIAAGVQHRQPCLGAATISGDVGGGEQTADGIADGRGRQAIAARQNPDKLAQGHGRIATTSACASSAWARGLCSVSSSVRARTRMFMSAVILNASRPALGDDVVHLLDRQ